MSIVLYLEGSPWFSSVIGGHMIVSPQFLKFISPLYRRGKTIHAISWISLRLKVNFGHVVWPRGGQTLCS